jgi:hypothetical protein
MDKRSSLLGKFVTYGRKKFYELSPGRTSDDWNARMNYHENAAGSAAAVAAAAAVRSADHHHEQQLMAAEAVRQAVERCQIDRVSCSFQIFSKFYYNNCLK